MGIKAPLRPGRRNLEMRKRRGIGGTKVILKTVLS
jgi:hypothetical protein